jgi:hypothetical protein
MELVNLKTGTDSYQDESVKPNPRRLSMGSVHQSDNETLKKLGATPQPVGTEVMITAKAIIKSMSTREDGEGVQHDASLQITDMALSPVSGEQPKTAAQTLYGGEDD